MIDSSKIYTVNFTLIKKKKKLKLISSIEIIFSSTSKTNKKKFSPIIFQFFFFFLIIIFIIKNFFSQSSKKIKIKKNDFHRVGRVKLILFSRRGNGPLAPTALSVERVQNIYLEPSATPRRGKRIDFTLLGENLFFFFNLRKKMLIIDIPWRPMCVEPMFQPKITEINRDFNRRPD